MSEISEIEERLMRDIAAVTGGVAVTESDLEDARESIDHRIEDRRKRGRRALLAGAVAAAVVIPVVGVIAFRTLGADESAPPEIATPPSVGSDKTFLKGAAPTSESLEGLWRVDNEQLLVRFTAPDRIAFDDRGTIYSDPAVSGRYVVSGDLITFTVTGGYARCDGQTFEMRASLPEPGALRFVPLSGFGNCATEQDDRWVLERALPTAPALADLDVIPAGGWQPLPRPGFLHGVWLADGGGRVLEIDPDGGYVVADESGAPVDRGRWTSHGSDLTLTSSAASEVCDAGDRLVVSGVEQQAMVWPALRGEVSENGCGAPWNPDLWIVLSHGGG